LGPTNDGRRDKVDCRRRRNGNSHCLWGNRRKTSTECVKEKKESPESRTIAASGGVKEGEKQENYTIISEAWTQNGKKSKGSSGNEKNAGQGAHSGGAGGQGPLRGVQKGKAQGPKCLRITDGRLVSTGDKVWS